MYALTSIPIRNPAHRLIDFNNNDNETIFLTYALRYSLKVIAYVINENYSAQSQCKYCFYKFCKFFLLEYQRY